VAYAQSKVTADKNAVLEKQQTQTLTDADRLILANAEPTLHSLEAVSDNITILSKNYLSCEKMENYYSNNYEAHKTDVAWLEAMISALYDKKCYNSLVLNKGALALNALKPTKQTAHQLGMLALKKGNTKDAVKYFDQSASLETTPDKKGDIYYEIASAYKNVDRAEAKKYALKAVELNPKSGKPYLMLAEMYNSVGKECELNDFDRKALIWLAIDTAKKAEMAEPKYKATVAALMVAYNKKKPTKDQAKAAGKKKGDTITYGCWINETVTVPNL
jgi:tetratricopeptide (TPR) repeat protein